MAATTQDVKDFFNLSGTYPLITDAQLLDVDDWLASYLGRVGAGAGAGAGTGVGVTPDDIVDFLRGVLDQYIVSYKRQVITPIWGVRS